MIELLTQLRIRKALAVFVILIAAFDVHGLMLEKLSMPSGFTISVYANNVPNARQLSLGPPGVLFVGTRELGQVYAVIDRDGDFLADEVKVIASGLNMPSGLSYRDGTLYVAEVNRILAFDGITADSREQQSRTVFADLPSDAHHGWKYIAFGPDGLLYIPVGAPCNVCEVEPPYGTILRLDLRSGTSEIFARGIRNSVGFAWHPRNHKFWFSDNGRDWMGDDRPGCELNRVDKPDQHFGYPYVHAAGIEDDQFKNDEIAERAVKPAKVLGAHVAPLGLLFYSGDQFPASYKHQLLVAEHGSWNRSRKRGYRVMLAEISDDDTVVDYRELVTGWLVGEAHWGRPVAFAALPDGSVLISDDHAGVIYRLRYDP